MQRKNVQVIIFRFRWEYALGIKDIKDAQCDKKNDELKILNHIISHLGATGVQKGARTKAPRTKAPCDKKPRFLTFYS